MKSTLYMLSGELLILTLIKELRERSKWENKKCKIMLYFAKYY